jgi:hypothetical protein
MGWEFRHGMGMGWCVHGMGMYAWYQDKGCMYGVGIYVPMYVSVHSKAVMKEGREVEA